LVPHLAHSQGPLSRLRALEPIEGRGGLKASEEVFT
jgi:hypothetical protein